MPLNKLDNFIKNTEGRILYVSPSDLDSTDSISNQGNSLARPFKTLQRALIESARFSYVKGRSNDIIEKTTILLMPGEHTVDNRPGLAIFNDGGTAKVREVYSSGSGNVASSSLNLNLNSNFDLSQDDNILYKFNSVDGGVVVPRGTSIVGLDLRKTKIRPKYVPNPTDSTVPSSSIFKVTGSCYFWQFSLFDANELENVFYKNTDFTLKATPTFSHHKLTVFEYCDGINKVKFGSVAYELTDLEMYYAKVGNAYNEGSAPREIETAEKYPQDPLAFEPQRPEYEIVGAFAADPLELTYIRAGNASGATSTVTVRTKVAHGYQVGTPIKIRGVSSSRYNVSSIVTSVSDSNDKEFTYTLNDQDIATLGQGDPSVGTVTIETDTVEGASPYIFNCSMRSVYGMNGLNANGDKATGFKSMVVAQFTGVSLQKDDRAFVKYNPSTRLYEGITIGTETGLSLSGGSSATATGQAYHLDSQAIYRQGWETTHISMENDAILQIVSVFAIGYAKHFAADTGGDASITNSNSNFGQLSLISKGFKDEAFEKDNKAWVTSIIPPRSIETTEEDIDWVGIDTSVGSTTKVYLSGFKSFDIKPPILTQGYRVGARVNDKLYVNVGVSTYSASIIMPDGGSSSKSYSVTSIDNASNIITIGTNDLDTGEKIIIISESGDLPENITGDTVYYAITESANSSRTDGIGLSATQIQLASSKAYALDAIPITIAGGNDLFVLTRVSDKSSGESGHPVQWDVSNGWYINVDSTGNTIFPNKSSITEEDISYIKRREDSRSLDEKIYKLRVVIPQELGNAKNPENGFIIQETSSTGARSDLDFNYSAVLTKSSDYEFKKNPCFISTCTESVTGIASITTELPHDLVTGNTVKILNVTDSVNAAGLANTGYNGTYDVTVLNDMQFTYEPTGGTSSFGSNSTNNINNRNIALPRFERVDWQSNLYVYRNDVISQYIDGEQDGIYHIYPLSADYTIPTEFSEYEYSQNVVDLYPQLDRDNINENPTSAVSFAKRAPLGEVNTSDLKKSITRESIDKFNKTIGFGVPISSIDGDNVITFTKSHGFSGIETGKIAVAGGSYPQNATFYNVKLRSGSVTGDWQGATAKVIVSGGAITEATIQSPGAGYTATSGGSNLYFDEQYLGSPGVVGRFQVQPSGYSDCIGNVVQVTGIGTTSGGYYKITSVPNDTQIAIARTAGDSIVVSGQYVIPLGPSVTVSSVTTVDTATGISTFNCSSAHGLVKGNSLRLLDTDNNNLGDYIVESRVDVDSFSSIIGSTLAATSVLKHGLSSNETVSDRTDENLAARGVSLYGDVSLTLSASATATSNTIQVNSGISTNKFPYGSYVQIDEEILRIASPVATGSNNTLTVIRGVLATEQSAHDNGSLVRSIKPYPIEFRRPSILRASGHTFEYLGYGPGNYSTALPQVQDRTLTEREEFLVQSQEKSGGIVVYTGMNNKGDFYIGNQKKSSATGEEVTFDTPIPTITGEDPSRLSVVFDEVTVKERILVEGGDSSQVLSEFDGPVNFNNKIKIGNSATITGALKLSGITDANSTAGGILKIEGGVGIKKQLHVGNTIHGTQLNLSGVATASDYKTTDTTVGSGGSITAGKFYGDGSVLENLPLPGSDTPLHFNDNVKLTFGNTIGVPDLEILHDTSNSIIRETGTGGLYLQSEGNVYITKESGAANDVLADFNATGAVTLYHNSASAGSSSKKFETLSTGVKVTGEIQSTDDITAFVSDIRLKDEISPITKALEKVKSISGFTYKHNETAKVDCNVDTGEQRFAGVSAQEIQKILPEVVKPAPSNSDYLTVQYEKLVPLLIEAIKELSDKVDNLEQKLSDK
tara:strand:+ start:701 stop:6211 length:5511 start_codon:yes stop_codon:yes gene_type:complete